MIHIERGKIDIFQVGDFSDITRIGHLIVKQTS